MKTRHAAEDTAFRQERYMSSAELERGLLANCVARRLSVVDCPKQREVIWFIQKISHAPGELEKLVQGIFERQAQRFATLTMQRLGTEAGRIYSAAEVQEIHAEFGAAGIRIPGADYNPPSRSGPEDGDEGIGVCFDHLFFPGRITPSDYNYSPTPVEAMQEACIRAAADETLEVDTYRKEKLTLTQWIFQQACLNPAIDLAKGVWFLPQLMEALHYAMEEWIAARSGEGVVTSIGSQIHDALDFCLEGKCLVTVSGNSRIGKTFAVDQWTFRHPGRARYVQVPPTGDETSFFRVIADALGIGSSRAYKTVDLREKIADALKGGDLMLIFDEAHYAWPRTSSRVTAPYRLNWILCELVNQGVPVALVSTPQFATSQRTFVKANGWSDAQLTGRIVRHTKLPESLPSVDLRAVALTYHPTADERALDIFVNYASASAKGLQGIEALFKCAAYVARKAGRDVPTTADIKQAWRESLADSDLALAEALQATKPAKAATRPLTLQEATPAVAMQTPRTRHAQPVQGHDFTAPRRDAGASVLQGHEAAPDSLLAEH